MILKTYIEKLLRRENLTAQEAGDAIKIILNGADKSQIAAFLMLLRAKQETADEILGILQTMRERMLPVAVNRPVLDIVGTGGDGANTINISTGAAILVASCGVTVAKHGNRAVSSICGSADVLEALGVNINMKPAKVEECIEKLGIGFCFAPNFHPAMMALKEIRHSLGIPTSFNILGPLLNPAAEYLLVGVFKEELVTVIADVVAKLNLKKSLIFHGNGLDELSCVGSVRAIEITKGEQKSYVLDPAEYGFSRCLVSDLRGGSPEENAEILLEIFKGKKGAIADTLIFNAAVALYVYKKTESINHAVKIVTKSIEAGKALKLLEDFVNFSHNKGKYNA